MSDDLKTVLTGGPPFMSVPVISNDIGIAVILTYLQPLQAHLGMNLIQRPSSTASVKAMICLSSTPSKPPILGASSNVKRPKMVPMMVAACNGSQVSYTCTRVSQQNTAARRPCIDAGHAHRWYQGSRVYDQPHMMRRSAHNVYSTGCMHIPSTAQQFHSGLKWQVLPHLHHGQSLPKAISGTAAEGDEGLCWLAVATAAAMLVRACSHGCALI